MTRKDHTIFRRAAGFTDSPAHLVIAVPRRSASTGGRPHLEGGDGQAQRIDEIGKEQGVRIMAGNGEHTALVKRGSSNENLGSPCGTIRWWILGNTFS